MAERIQESDAITDARVVIYENATFIQLMIKNEYNENMLMHDGSYCFCQMVVDANT